MDGDNEIINQSKSFNDNKQYIKLKSDFKNNSRNKNCRKDAEHLTKESVILDKIIPSNVKQIWMKVSNATEKQQREHTNKDQTYKRMIKSNENKTDMSREYGDAFISHDLAHNQNNKQELFAKKRNKSVSESPELPVARHKWGINLRHVETKENIQSENKQKSSEPLPFGFPRLRRLSSSSKSRPLSQVNNDYLLGRKLSNSKEKSKSLDVLSVDNVFNQTKVDIDKLNESFQEDVVSVRKLGNKFGNVGSDRKYSNSKPCNIFESEINSSVVNGSTEYKNKHVKQAINLADLLRKDEINLTKDVLEETPVSPVLQPPNPKKFTSQSFIKEPVIQSSNSMNKDPANSDKSLSLKPDDINLRYKQKNLNLLENESVKVTENKFPNVPETNKFVEANPNPEKNEVATELVKINSNIESENNEFVKANQNKIPEQNELANNQLNTAIEISELSNSILKNNKPNTPSDLKEKEIDNTNNETMATKQHDTIINKSLQNKTVNLNTEKVVPSPIVVHQKKPKIVRKIQASAPPMSKSINHSKPKNSYVFKLDKKEQVIKKEQQKDLTNDSNLKYNKLGQVILNTDILSTNENQDKNKKMNKETTKENQVQSEKDILQIKANNSIIDHEFNVNQVNLEKNVSPMEIKYDNTIVKTNESVLNNLVKPSQSTSNNLVKQSQPVSNNIIKPSEPESNNIVKTNKSASNTIVKPSEPVSNTIIKPSEPASNTIIKPSEPVSNTIIKPNKPVSNNIVRTNKSASNTIVKPSEPVSNTIIKPNKPASNTIVEPREPVSNNIEIKNKGINQKEVVNQKYVNRNIANKNRSNEIYDLVVESTKADNKIKKPSPVYTIQPSKLKRRVGKLIIMSGEERDQDLKKRAKRAKSPSNGVSMTVESTDPKKHNGLALTFMSNELDEIDEDPNLPPPVVPKIIFNNPVPDVKSIISKSSNKNRKRVTFSTKNIATIHHYPSEKSFFQEDRTLNAKSESSITSVSLPGLNDYQPVNSSDIGSYIQRERERISYESSLPPEHMDTQIQYSSEGDHFNTHSNQDGGHAMLF